VEEEGLFPRLSLDSYIFIRSREEDASMNLFAVFHDRNRRLKLTFPNKENSSV
jgi:hypothetical protein